MQWAKMDNSKGEIRMDNIHHGKKMGWNLEFAKYDIAIFGSIQVYFKHFLGTFQIFWGGFQTHFRLVSDLFLPYVSC